MNSDRTRLITFVTAIAIVIGMWSSWGVSNAEAIIIICKSGMFGVTRNETVRSYVVNTGEAKGIIINYRILDMAGTTLAQSSDMRLALGQAAFFELDAATLDFHGALRFPLRVEISIGNPEMKTFRQSVDISSVEVFDTDTGKTTFVLIDPESH
jgi:hypothetical protein